MLRRKYNNIIKQYTLIPRIKQALLQNLKQDKLEVHYVLEYNTFRKSIKVSWIQNISVTSVETIALILLFVICNSCLF